MSGVELEISGFDFRAIRERINKRLTDAQNILTLECKKAADVYTPMDTGMLKNNFEYTKDEHGALDGWRYHEKYARRQWEGTKGNGEPFNYSLVANDKARRRWTDHAAAANKDEIVQKVKKALEE